MWLSHRHTAEPLRFMVAERQGRTHELKKCKYTAGEGDRWGAWEKAAKETEEVAPSRPCTTVCICLYLAQGPQIVMRAPGPCVLTGKNCCHTYLHPGPDPGSGQHRGKSRKSTLTQNMCKAQYPLMEQMCDRMQTLKDHHMSITRSEQRLSCLSSLGFGDHEFLSLCGSLSPQRLEKGRTAPSTHFCWKINHLSCWTGLTFNANVKSRSSHIWLFLLAF